MLRQRHRPEPHGYVQAFFHRLWFGQRFADPRTRRKGKGKGRMKCPPFPQKIQKLIKSCDPGRPFNLLLHGNLCYHNIAERNRLQDRDFGAFPWARRSLKPFLDGGYQGCSVTSGFKVMAGIAPEISEPALVYAAA
jgi:hypothetical protein